jgi:hypothetical protein
MPQFQRPVEIFNRFFLLTERRLPDKKEKGDL